MAQTAPVQRAHLLLNVLFPMQVTRHEAQLLTGTLAWCQRSTHQLAVPVRDVAGILVPQSSDYITCAALVIRHHLHSQCRHGSAMGSARTQGVATLTSPPQIVCGDRGESPPRADRLLLMACVSLRRSPLAPDAFSRSLPARSIRFSTPACAHRDCHHQPGQTSLDHSPTMSFASRHESHIGTGCAAAWAEV